MIHRSSLPRLLVSLLAALLGACSQIPTTGPVSQVSMTAQGRVVQIAPEPPQAGMSASRVVEGFLQAMADPTGGYGVARQYLSETVRDSWNPEAQTLVYEGWVEENDGAFALHGTTKGAIDPVGRYLVSETEINHEFGVVEEGGEWRIAAPPDGVLLSNYIFARSYTPVKSYFVANAGRAVLPDLLHMPQSEVIPARIIAAQLAGPSQDLSPAVHNAIPAGVSIGPGGATVDTAGTVTVDLDGLPATLSDEAKRELGAQLLWSLSSIPRVTGIKITSGGRPYAVPGQNEQLILELSSQQGYQPLSRASTADLYGVSDTQPGRLNPDGAFIANSSELGPVSMTAASLDGTLIAFVTGDPAVVRIGPSGGGLVAVDTGLTDATGAQFAQGKLWLLGTDARGQQQILSLSSQGAVSAIDSTALPGQIVDFSVDASGARIAAIVRRDGQTQLGTAVVAQGGALSAWQELKLAPSRGAQLSDYAAVDWTGEVALVVVARGSANPSVFVARSDGSEVNDLGPISSAPVQVTALPRLGGDAIAARASDGKVLLYQPSSTWRSTEATLSWISYPG
ncbi:MAG: LpqB family beta-propeller domain-containing protein [Propionibacteriaceae bacterium]|nr:LpqB family beta-propeller domain-containing protein [Propionibacteriaceae bacterium]